MGWTGVILHGSGGFKKIAANGQGDLQKALGSSSTSHITLMTVPYVNPCAKYKPVRHTQVAGPLTDAQRASVRYGMGEPPTFAPNTTSQTVPAWTYLRPVSGTNPLRATDFIKDYTSTTEGYDPNAVPPLKLELTDGIKIGEEFVIVVYPNSYAGNGWTAGRSLSLQELLQSKYDYYTDYYIGFVFHDLTNKSSACVVTNKKFPDIANVGTFLFHPQGDGTSSGGDYVASGVHYPQITMLNDYSRVGDDIRVSIVLVNGAVPSNYAYKIKATNESVISLGFDENKRTDMITAKASAIGSVMSLTGQLLSGPTLVKTGTATSPLTSDWYEYTVSSLPIKCKVIKPNGWLQKAVDVELTMSCDGGVLGPSYSGNSHTRTINVLIPAGSGESTVNLVTSLDTALPKIYIYKDATKAVKFTAKFKQAGKEKVFSNTLTITA